MDLVERHKSSISRLNSSLLSRTHNRRDENTEASQKGPLGLDTLYIPNDTTIADLVFVHGLGGGSRSTWTKNGEPSLYWPQQWLPNDPGFRDVRIHSFGYNSNWEKESSLNIHDFSKSLLASIHDCPSIPRASNVRTVLFFVVPRMSGVAPGNDGNGNLVSVEHEVLTAAYHTATAVSLTHRLSNRSGYRWVDMYVGTPDPCWAQHGRPRD